MNINKILLIWIFSSCSMTSPNQSQSSDKDSEEYSESSLQGSEEANREFIKTTESFMRNNALFLFYHELLQQDFQCNSDTITEKKRKLILELIEKSEQCQENFANTNNEMSKYDGRSLLVPPSITKEEEKARNAVSDQECKDRRSLKFDERSGVREAKLKEKERTRTIVADFQDKFNSLINDESTTRKSLTADLDIQIKDMFRDMEKQEEANYKSLFSDPNKANKMIFKKRKMRDDYQEKIWNDHQKELFRFAARSQPNQSINQPQQKTKNDTRDGIIDLIAITVVVGLIILFLLKNQE